MNYYIRYNGKICSANQITSGDYLRGYDNKPKKVRDIKTYKNINIYKITTIKDICSF